MSWQPYSDKLVNDSNGALTGGVIAGNQGGIWAKTNFNPSLQEINVLLQGLKDPSKLFENGLVMEGKKYSVTFAQDGEVRACRSEGSDKKAGIVAIQGPQCTCIGYFADGDLRTAAVSVGTFSDYMKEMGY